MKIKCQKLIITMLMFLLCIIPIHAQEEKQTVKVGFWEDYGVSVNNQGAYSGYGYDYLMDIAKINDWDLEFIACSWTEGLKLLEEGKIDLFGMLQKTPQREKIYAFPDFKFGYEYGVLYTSQNNNAIYYNDPKSLDGKIIGTIKDISFDEQLKKYGKENNISFQFKYYSDTSALQTALDEREIDLLFTGSIQKVLRAKVALKVSHEPIYYATSLNNKTVLDGLNYALQELVDENIYYNANLQSKYYHSSAISLETFTQEERKYIDEHQNLAMGFHLNWKPFDFFSQKMNRYEGISVDVATKISEISGLNFNYVQTKSDVETTELLKSHEIDIIGGLIDSDLILEKFDLEATDPYMHSSFVFIGKRGADLSSKDQLIVAVPENSIGSIFRVTEDYSELEANIYNDARTCLNAVLEGEVNYAVLNSYSAGEYLQGSKYNQLAIISTMKEEIPIGFGIHSSDKILLSIINKSIHAIEAEEINQIIFKHTIGIPYRAPFNEIVEQNIFSIVILISLFVILFVGYLFWSKSRREKELNKIAYFDPLTKNINFIRFKQKLQKTLQEVTNQKYAIVSVDINKFKYINDAWGYEYGDQLLILLSNEIELSLLDGEFYARENADKFVILIKYINSSILESRFNLFSSRVDLYCNSLDKKLKIILSMGYYRIKTKDHNITAVIDRANFARKAIKNNHKSSYAEFDKRMFDRINAEKQIENIMDSALAEKQFVVFLQPKFSIKKKKIAGAEALVRWNHPEKGLISPAEFIPVFEKNGFIISIDYYVFEQTCIKLKEWMTNQKPVVPISINLSRRHIERSNMPEDLFNISQKYGIDPKWLELEITESTFVESDITVIVNLMNALHKYGFLLSMDDFGSGLSSLTQLKDLPIDVLKLDKSFFSSSHEDPREKALFFNVIKLSKDMGISTIAEGVETEEQYHILEEGGCDMAQGYLMGRSMPMQEFEDKFLQDLIETKHE